MLKILPRYIVFELLKNVGAMHISVALVTKGFLVNVCHKAYARKFDERPSHSFHHRGRCKRRDDTRF